MNIYGLKLTFVYEIDTLWWIKSQLIQVVSLVPVLLPNQPCK